MPTQDPFSMALHSYQVSGHWLHVSSVRLKQYAGTGDLQPCWGVWEEEELDQVKSWESQLNGPLSYESLLPYISPFHEFPLHHHSVSSQPEANTLI